MLVVSIVNLKNKYKIFTIFKQKQVDHKDTGNICDMGIAVPIESIFLKKKKEKERESLLDLTIECACIQLQVCRLSI